MLDAISNASVSASTAPSLTTDWPRSGPFAGSPGNLISLMGDSPPTQPSSYEDAPGGRLGHQPPWATTATHRGFMNPSPASASPPANSQRPLSFPMEDPARQQHRKHLHHRQSPEPSLPHSRSPPSLGATVAAGPGYRRSSLQTRSAAHHQPPLPHQPQPHFYGTPDLDLAVATQSGIKAGQRGYHFGFDRLPSTSADRPGSADHVVTAGYQGGLDVYAVSKRGLEPVGGLKGLHGAVLHAKILPWSLTGPQRDVFPLVAVVLHGPVLRPQDAPTPAAHSAAQSPAMGTGAASPRSAFGQPEARPPVDSYQTSVQVYSLRTGKRVDTLLTAPEVPISTAIALTSPAFQPPAPVGAFTIEADSGTLVVCSGTTGECWVFLQRLEPQNGHMFACVGKLWTALQQSRKADAPGTDEGTQGLGGYAPSTSASRGANASAPIFALNGRWIAYCPSPPLHKALGASVATPIAGRAPGVLSMSPPHLPAAAASVDLIADSFVNKFMRGTTQELIWGAKWMGQQGKQAWNSYWNKSTNPQPQQMAAAPPQQPRSPPPTAHFPPTHGALGGPHPRSPGLVSIVDAETLAASASVVPITSFVPPQGCSFLSFSPTSLALFTASSKGDVQNVWDLLRIHHTKASPLQATMAPAETSGPVVRQIAQFSRMTVARVVHVAWSEPHGERLAMVTGRGTVHVLDMPPSAFMWPAPRRRKPAEVKNPEAADAGSSSSAVTITTNAFSAAYQAAKPFVSRARRSSAHVPSTMGASAGQAFKESAAQGGRALAAGISNSLGKTGTAFNQFRVAGENRVALPNTTSLPAASCVTWVRSRRSHSLFTMGDGLVRVFPAKARQMSTQSKRPSRTRRYKDFKVPGLPDDAVPPAIRQIVHLGAEDEVLDLTDHDMEAGDNTLTLGYGQRKRPAPDLSADAAIPQAEIESSAAYQPFHTDRRVTLNEYAPGRRGADAMESLSGALADASLEDSAVLNERNRKKKKDSKKKAQSSSSEVCEGRTAATDSLSAWAFGQPIPVVTWDLGQSFSQDDQYEDMDGHPQALPPSAMERVMEYGDHAQIVVTTRKRRGGRASDGDGEGFFEDECELLEFADQRV
ncbi:hypothetical protein GMORB2_2154 [Geosmithia morbida]|uniref:Uncharacterized protein n=1 Tax=Geosmithia morbida TaxID=1094350 RepID=A0A9P4YSV0_9HYPO|nr:uncharacterized protein GMORB2_2154 [Geosmithia morbida]KAF4121192.1 hypothetical protein GMORB2_2154 [Geosmithia morbida]